MDLAFGDGEVEKTQPPLTDGIAVKTLAGNPLRRPDHSDIGRSFMACLRLRRADGL